MNHKHFTIEERESIFKFLAQKKSISFIAAKLKKNRVSIYREINRNSVDGDYTPNKAQFLYKKRKQLCGRKHKLRDSILLVDIQEKLESGWSPEQISGRAKLDNQYSISFKTIYRAIYLDFLTESTKYLLTRKGKQKPRGLKETRGKIPNKKMIEERSEEANDRSEIGHFESDTIVGAGKKGAMMTYVDRKSRYLVAELMINRKSDTFNEATIENFKYIPKKYIKTFTSDNGKEFSKFKELEEALGIKAYFANPYHSWERGTNENTNGLLRRTFPKGTIFSKIKRCEFYKAVNKINNRPRKCLNWKTPKEVFWGEIEKCCI